MTNIRPHLLMMLALLLIGCQANAQGARSDHGDTTAPASPQAVDLLNKIEAATAKLDTLKARIKYTRIQTLTGDQQERYGDFYYAASVDRTPTRFAVLFDRLVIADTKRSARPMQTWYIFDGNWLLERDHDAKQAVRRELVPKGGERDGIISLGGGQMPIPLKLKADEVLKAYHVKRLPDEPSKYDKDTLLHRLELTPRKGGKDAAAMDLWFDRQTLLLFRLVTTENAEDIELILPKPEMNAGIKPELFETTLPDADQGWQAEEVPLKG